MFSHEGQACTRERAQAARDIRHRLVMQTHEYSRVAQRPGPLGIVWYGVQSIADAMYGAGCYAMPGVVTDACPSITECLSGTRCATS